MTVYAGIAVYNCMDRPWQMAIQSVRRFVDRIVLVDGSWDGKPSADGTQTYLEHLAGRDPQIEVCWANSKWKSEWDKRQAMNDWGEPGDWTFVIDTDETLECGGPWLQKAQFLTSVGGKGDLPFYCVVRDQNDRTYWRANLWPHGHRYGDAPEAMNRVPIVVRHYALPGPMSGLFG